MKTIHLAGGCFWGVLSAEDCTIDWTGLRRSAREPNKKVAHIILENYISRKRTYCQQREPLSYKVLPIHREKIEQFIKEGRNQDKSADDLRFMPFACAQINSTKVNRGAVYALVHFSSTIL